MEQVIIPVERRTKSGKGSARRLRREGKIPGIAYKGGNNPIHFAIDSNDLMKRLRRRGKNTLIYLDFQEDSAEQPSVMLKKLQRHPVTRNPLHVDFLLVDLNETVQVKVKLDLTGRSKGIALGGIMDFVRREVMIECLPKDIPDQLSVDITEVDLNQALHVSDITPPEGIRIIDDAQYTILTVTSAIKEEETGEEEDA